MQGRWNLLIAMMAVFGLVFGGLMPGSAGADDNTRELVRDGKVYGEWRYGPEYCQATYKNSTDISTFVDAQGLSDSDQPDPMKIEPGAEQLYERADCEGKTVFYLAIIRDGEKTVETFELELRIPYERYDRPSGFRVEPGPEDWTFTAYNDPGSDGNAWVEHYGSDSVLLKPGDSQMFRVSCLPGCYMEDSINLNETNYKVQFQRPVTPTVSATPSSSPTATVSPTETTSSTPAPTSSATVTVSPTNSPTETATASPTKVPTKAPTTTRPPANTPAPPSVKPDRPSDGSWLYTTPGLHKVNGRTWFTKCEPYSQTTRCFTSIISGKRWVHNNLTYLPSSRDLWKGNPLAANGEYGAKLSWTSAGRQWYAECDTPQTGRNGCRNYIKDPRTGKRVLNGIVQFEVPR